MASDWTIRRYTEADAKRWNEFAASSRNATFLFQREYMDYHRDRFEDCSWLAMKGESLRALLPANITADGTLHSHGGLSYGGWILPQAHLDGADLLEIFQAACEEWRKEGIRCLDYKPLPSIYSERPSQEDIYALFRLGGVLKEVNMSATIDLRSPGSLNKLQRRHLASANQRPIEVTETADIKAFMAMLADCLRERHDTTPVHNTEEMERLARLFPDNIRFFATMLDGRMEAGVCIYDTGLVAHAQYIATTPEGRRLNLLTPLFHYLIKDRYADRRYFDFGISNEDHGKILNAGLLRQKYSYGATATAFLRYTLDL